MAIDGNTASLHREQTPERGSISLPENSEFLAEPLIAAYNGLDRQQDDAEQEMARNRFPGRRRAFGEWYLAIVKRASEPETNSL